MTRQEAEDYIYASYLKAKPYHSYDQPDSVKRHPEYSRAIIEKLYDGSLSVAVTGSKGKGSVSYMLSSILSLYGKTGLMTGPHIEKFNERFMAGGLYISDTELVKIVSELSREFDRISCDPEKGEFISPIGIETAIAETFFADHQTDFEIYEHGKGVKYDDVRNVPASYGIINSVFPEHLRELGDTIEEIAADKSCIIRSGMKGIFCGFQTDKVRDIIISRAKKEGVPLWLFGRDFDVSDIRFPDNGMSCTVTTGRRRYENLELSLMGTTQCRNLSLALKAAEEIIGEEFCNSDADMDRLRRVLNKLEWFGRLSLISRDPFILIDCCINRESAGPAIEVLGKLGIKKAVAVLVIPDDKDYEGVAEAVFDAGCEIVLSEAANPHYRFSRRRQERLNAVGIECGYCKDLGEAIAGAKEPVVVLGTTAMLCEIRQYLRRMHW